MALTVPETADPWVKRLIRVLNAELTRKEPTIIGWRNDGTKLHLRFRAALDTPWVLVHVQSTAVGEGGLTYDPANYTSETTVDCRVERLQDIEVTGTATKHYVAWLIPLQKDGAGATVRYDGVAADDQMSFVDLGVQ